MQRFEGKVAIITGNEGAKITIHGTEEDELTMTIHLLVCNGVPGENIFVVQGAIDKEETLHNLVDRTVQKFGRIDILVNNTGGIPQQTLNALSSASSTHAAAANNGQSHGTPNSSGLTLRVPGTPTMKTNHNDAALTAAIAGFDYMFNINLKSITTLTRLAMPHLEETKGAVVNVSCFGAQKAFSDYVHYAQTKQALDSYCKNAAVKYVKRGVRINNVNPGFITGLTLDDKSKKVNKFEHNWIKNNVPMGRGGTAEEIARVIAFLASDDASYIAGQCIVVDGGASLTMATGGDGEDLTAAGAQANRRGSIQRKASIFNKLTDWMGDRDRH